MSEAFPERSSTVQPETDSTHEVAIEKIPELLGFVETEELRRTRSFLVDVMSRCDGEAIGELGTYYRELAVRIVENFQGEEYAKAQMGLSLTMSLIRRDAGRVEEYLEDVEDALYYATGMGFDDIAAALRQALNEAL